MKNDFIYCIILLLFPVLILANQEETHTKKKKVIMINDFEKGIMWNTIENRSGVFHKKPSKCFVKLGEYKSTSKRMKESLDHYLILEFYKGKEGGPGNVGGWCGWYTLLKTEDDIYLNLSGYNYIKFYYKPINRKETFSIGIADRKWDQIGDSVYIQDPLENYIVKKMKNGWREVIIPLNDFEGLDLSKMASFTLNFKPGKGVIFLDDIMVGYDKKYDADTYTVE